MCLYILIFLYVPVCMWLWVVLCVCFIVLSCWLCMFLSLFVCVLCRNASPALCCMAGEDWAYENAAEGRLVSQRTVRWRTDPAPPVSSAWTLWWGNCLCVCMCVHCRCFTVHRASVLWDLCSCYVGLMLCAWYVVVASSALNVLVTFVCLCVSVCYSRRCCCSTSPTRASQTQLGKLHWTSLANLDVLEWVQQ